MKHFQEIVNLGIFHGGDYCWAKTYLDSLAAEDGQAAELVKLRVFADFSVEEAGQTLGLSRATADRQWSFARAWLKDAMHSETEP
jgi:DNA-directed RNA polymerase specialized sigma24 family protein